MRIDIIYLKTACTYIGCAGQSMDKSLHMVHSVQERGDSLSCTVHSICTGKEEFCIALCSWVCGGKRYDTSFHAYAPNV